MFIARISRGRTIREFVLGVLIVPTIITFFWLSSFGGSALFLELNHISDIKSAVDTNVATSLYELLSNFPIAKFTSIIAIVLVTSFFVTSSDSGSLVVDSLTAGGKLDAPVAQRIFWALTEGLVAAVLLLGGGLGALQTASILTGLPFALILIIMMISLNKGLTQEHYKLTKYSLEKERENKTGLIKEIIKKNKK